MGAFMPITNSIIITNITELTNIINSNIIQTNFITETITNTTTSWGDPTLWITFFGAFFTAITAGIMLRSVFRMEDANKISAESVKNSKLSQYISIMLEFEKRLYDASYIYNQKCAEITNLEDVDQYRKYISLECQYIIQLLDIFEISFIFFFQIIKDTDIKTISLFHNIFKSQAQHLINIHFEKYILYTEGNPNVHRRLFKHIVKYCDEVSIIIPKEWR